MPNSPGNYRFFIAILFCLKKINSGYNLQMSLKDFLNDQNRQFGLLLTVVLLGIFLYKAFFLDIISIFLLLTSLILIVFTIFFPKVYYIPSKLWIRFGYLLGSLVTPLILTLVYVFTIIPINLLLRVLNYDILKLKKTNKLSYWIIRNQKSTNFKDQF